MDVSRKKRRIDMKSRDSEKEDKISSLPDEVLGRILSFLPTKYAVATSILSSEWKNLYKLTTTLDFDDSMSYSCRKNLGNERRNNDASFKKFVSRILVQCKKSHISKFRLRWEHDIELRRLHSWMNAVFVHKIIELDLSIITNKRMYYELELCRLTCENLVVLKLDCSLVLCVPCSVKFPRLKVLYFKGVMFHESGSDLIDDPRCKRSSNYHGLNGMLSGCPLLEELVIDGCDWNCGDLYFTNSLLRSLTLDCGLTGPLDQLYGCTIYIDLPSLVYFKYDEFLVKQYEIRNLKSVIEAHLVVAFNDDEFDEPQDLCDAMLDLIKGVCNCHTLNLSSQCLEALTSGDFELPNFKNMTHLLLALGHDVSWNDVLLDFLHCAPCLEYLTLEQGVLRGYRCQSDGRIIIEDEGDFAFCLKRKVLPSCVRHRLRFLNIVEYRGFEGEIEMVRCFLDNANVLEKMVIHWDERMRTQDADAKEKEILKLPKSSPSCSISFIWGEAMLLGLFNSLQVAVSDPRHSNMGMALEHFILGQNLDLLSQINESDTWTRTRV